jgi:dTDP-glucose pyrophosphorylase
LVSDMIAILNNPGLSYMSNFKSAFLTQDSTLQDALKNMNDSGFRAALVVDRHEKLLGLVTDFDIRSALMKGFMLDARVDAFMNKTPKVGKTTMEPGEYRKMMVKFGTDCLPIVDEKNRVANLVLLREFVEKDNLLSPIVIMAGGQGKRLWPLTQDTPKPLLQVGDRPMLGHILNHVKMQGFRNLFVSTHYKSEQIEDFLENNTPQGLETQIIKEENPLGTAGCLKGLQNEPSDEPIFIMNGDILTTLDFQAMLNWHRTHENVLTLACRQYTVEIPYGILETEGQRLTGIEEKPRKVYNMNAGIYLVEREALRHIPENKYFDMTDLMNALLQAGLPVGTFPISEPWIDIGKHEDYELVNQETHRYLPRQPLVL